MWTWDQSAGAMSRAGKTYTGYSGAGRGKNNPLMRAAVGTGPIPRGRWRMTEVRSCPDSTGPFTIVLEPMPGTDTCGRSAFRIHGDSIAHPGRASHGCIILQLAVRKAIWASMDRMLEVVA